MFGARIGRGVQIFPSASVMLPWLLTIEDHVVVAWGVNIYNLGPISIGAHTVISQFSHLCGGTHEFATEKFTLLRTGLTIGRNVWIAADAFVGPGVAVGDNSVVGARAVVVTDVKPNTLVAGNPARFVKDINKPTRA
jgi:putative colanic acid biosynthesis acetyltransferase WcaF